MSDRTGLGIRSDGSGVDPAPARIEYVVHQRPLQRVLAFTGKSIDDVVNCPIAKNHVRGYYKLHRFIERGCEVVDLERQWNG
jgi:hypothetical protein